MSGYCSICSEDVLFLLIGLQHGVIRPNTPYGMPLRVTTLPQQLKKAGKKCIYSYRTTVVKLLSFGPCMHFLWEKLLLKKNSSGLANIQSLTNY